MNKLHYLLKHKKVDFSEKINKTEFEMKSNSLGETVICLNNRLAIKRLRNLFELHRLSNCTKTNVACLIYNEQMTESAAGVNYVFGVSTCNVTECKKDFGQKPKHRHNICQALHSEEFAMRNWFGGNTEEPPHHAFVTRYPCENCVKKMSALGTKVIYYSTEDANGHLNILSDKDREYLEQAYGVLILSITIN